ncbi:hypothetical protein E2C01_051511 [Portunus trituberculatus]|uniref:Uncharacterized protein n=1 Tax=Portunus trituberculatus TaxID=210409 RepID=A0A5B7GBT7_PORTR|nr:hypothetical protein [Portunus trituberculatus]
MKGTWAEEQDNMYYKILIHQLMFSWYHRISGVMLLTLELRQQRQNTALLPRSSMSTESTTLDSPLRMDGFTGMKIVECSTSHTAVQHKQ